MTDALELAVQELTEKVHGIIDNEEPFRPSKAKKVLEDSEPDTICTFLAVKSLLEDSFLAWEPESIWQELERQDILLNEVTKQKFLALMTLTIQPSFYWDADVFSQSTGVFNGQEPALDALEPYPAEYIAWAVIVAAVFMNTQEFTEPDYDREAQVYTAVCLHEDGFASPPPILSFAREALETQQTKKNTHLARQTREGWSALDKGELETHDFVETPLGMQLAKWAGVYTYLKARVDACSQTLSM